MIRKQILVSQRIRRPAREGFSWIDRRFLQEHSAALSRDALLLYFFLAAVSDQHGLSFWSDVSTAVRLRLTELDVVRAREELLASDLIAFSAPLTQVLSIPDKRVQRGGPQQLGELFRALAGT
jgi:hypothetical protein